MTFRAKPAVKRSHRPSWETAGRRTLYTTIFFGITVALSLVLLVGVAVAFWYGDHLRTVASVNGESITIDEVRERALINSFRYDVVSARIRTDLGAGRLSQASADAQQAQVDQQRQALVQNSISQLIDNRLMAGLAAEMGITVTDADVEARLREEAVQKREVHAWMIAVKPATARSGATTPTPDAIAAAKAAAEKALAELKAGKDWIEVAKKYSTDPTNASGGELGWAVEGTETNLDQDFVNLLFTLPVNTPTDIILGDDGIYRIGRITEDLPESTDPGYQQRITNAKVDLDAYRRAVRTDLIQQRLSERVTADALAPTLQRRVSEIFLQRTAQSAGDEVHSRHILFSPDNDPNTAGNVPETDPAWKQAEDDARAAYAALKPYIGRVDELRARFMAAAKESDDPSGTSTGGDLGFVSKGAMVPEFEDAIFKTGLKPGDLLEPVKTNFGWHVIMFEERRPSVEERANGLKLEALKPGASFAELARKNSDADTKDRGGDLGWVAPYQLDAALEKVIFETPVGSVSDPYDLEPTTDEQGQVTDPGGFYLYKVVEESMRAAEGAQIKNLKDNAFPRWYTVKRNEAKIDVDQAFLTTDAAQ